MPPTGTAQVVVLTIEAVAINVHRVSPIPGAESDATVFAT